MNRRLFVKAGMASLPLFYFSFKLAESKKLKLSLSQWALHREHFGNARKDYQQWRKWLEEGSDLALQGPLKPLDFPLVAKRDFGVDAVEYVNVFFYRKDQKFFKELLKRSKDAGVKNLLIMVDEEGYLGHPDLKLRNESIERHKRWLDAAAILGCKSIRVNAHSIGTKEEQKKYTTEGLSSLCDLAKPMKLDILIENHGGMSSEPEWLMEVIRATGKTNIGTMVDFDNFDYSEKTIWNGELRYDRYKGVELLMPLAKSVSSKAHAFDGGGNEKSIDFERMLKIIKAANFEGYISIEYEGDDMTEREGIKATKALLERYM
jgi:sugar phosphate isomerase/epimerase